MVWIDKTGVIVQDVVLNRNQTPLDIFLNCQPFTVMDQVAADQVSFGGHTAVGLVVDGDFFEFGIVFSVRRFQGVCGFEPGFQGVVDQVVKNGVGAPSVYMNCRLAVDKDVVVHNVVSAAADEDGLGAAVEDIA